MPNKYILQILVKCGSDSRRFCEVTLKGWDCYVVQPPKTRGAKISYHESGQIHLKIGKSGAMFKRFNEPPASLLYEENVWAQSFENFSALAPWEKQPASNIHEIDIGHLPCDDTLTLAQVIVGRRFNPSGWIMDGVEQTVVTQKIFKPDAALSGLSVCVRVVTLRNIGGAG